MLKGKYKNKILNALRSGEYKQTRGKLRSNRNGFCCLGVMCDVVDPKGWTQDGVYISPWQYDKDDCTLSENMRKKLGLTIDEVEMLEKSNDSWHWGFKKIADLIEKKL